MEIEIWQLENIIRAAAKEAVEAFAIKKDPTIDEVSESQAQKLGFGRHWISNQCAIGALSWIRSGVHKNSPKIFSLKKLKELKNGVNPLLKNLS